MAYCIWHLLCGDYEWMSVRRGNRKRTREIESNDLHKLQRDRTGYRPFLHALRRPIDIVRDRERFHADDTAYAGRTIRFERSADSRSAACSGHDESVNAGSCNCTVRCSERRHAVLSARTGGIVGPNLEQSSR